MVKVLFDKNVPHPLGKKLSQFDVSFSEDKGWARLRNGELLECAAAAGFDVLVTADKNLKYQNNLTGRKISVLVLPSGLWPKIEPIADRIASCIEAIRPGQVYEMAAKKKISWFGR